jgi:hypothetical protein
MGTGIGFLKAPGDMNKRGWPMTYMMLRGGEPLPSTGQDQSRHLLEVNDSIWQGFAIPVASVYRTGAHEVPAVISSP